MNRDLSAVARRLVSGVAIVACAAGVGVWGAILLAPTPSALPPALAGATIQNVDVSPVAEWFGAGAGSRVKIVSSGLIAAGDRGTAILAVDGQRPRAYGVGQALANDLVLSQVRPHGVVITQGADSIEVTMPALPPVKGIEPAGASSR